MQDAFLHSLESLIGAESVDTSGVYPVYRPVTLTQLADIVRECHNGRHGIIFTGGGTYPPCGDTEGLVHVSMRALDTVVEVNVDDFIIVTQTGAIIDDLVAVAGQFGLQLPITLSSGDRATIGGTFMSGAFIGGQAPGRMGKMVTGVRAVAANGEVMTFGGRTVKNVTGFDVTRFLGGTLGLFAVAAEITLKALPMPEYRTTVTIQVPGGQASDLVQFLAGAASAPTVGCDLIAPDGLAGTVTAGVSFEGFKDQVNADVRRLTDGCESLNSSSVKSRNENRFMKNHRMLATTIAKPGMYTLTVPPASLTALIQRLMVLVPDSPVIAHLAHGRLHLADINDDTRTAIDTLSCSLGGTHLSSWGQVGERGLASLLTPAERELAESLKRELDPLRILNPHIRL